MNRRRINSQNNRYYALAGSHQEETYFDVDINREKVSVWACGIVGKWDSDRTSFLRKQPKWGKVLSNVGIVNHFTD